MSEIVPAILVETEEKYKELVEKIKPFAQRVHIDISDGEFAPAKLLPIEKMQWPQGWIVDIHAMVMHPRDYVDKLIALKPSLIVFHAETLADLPEVFEKIKKAGIRAGLAILKPTVPATVADAIKAVDHVLIFSGDLGHYGGNASMMQLEKIRLIKAINPNLEIGWDGGVNIENAFSLAQGGVDVLNVGGAIGNAEDPNGVYGKLIEAIKKQGVI